ncbi:bifunctional 2-polyprenyl-6-hydroxyphenol methylase/3-demethylubiquinol 3-O-methyltransferase UbiG [Brevibacillus sp. Leaf182]|uniref:class I SAM-dependent methyltransferase n=1 Tax=Brevibacillus sp. Leaf182 TaxID=1736290 RepID=UPI0007009378|nr:class I SAM-dependent methyltransferase [Brevibacillus sp. Leaf182]RAT94549.1 methyltransferase domain-containing protein [Brevibacillus sp. Leaf182]
MAIVQLRSENPDFSYMIKKNPNSGMSLRSIRKGIAYGWFSNADTYNVYFKDAENEVSYKQSEQEHFEYLNVSRYNTPLFPLNAINEFFSAPMKQHDERDAEGYEHVFFINMIHIERLLYLTFFEKHLKDFTFELKHHADKSYALTITTRTSLHQLLHVVSVLCLFLSMFGKEHIDISDNILDKYIKSIHVIDAPFYIRSLFARNFLTTRERYRKYKTEIEKTSRYPIQLEYGSTGLQRRNYISSKLPFTKSIVDIGCGEGFYAIPFATKLPQYYYAIDINEQSLDLVRRRAVEKEISNLILFSSLDQFLQDYNGEQVDVILTEVIEHMSKEEARVFIKQICSQLDFDHFIITTPNSDFNQFYELEGYRHDDHKWEMGQEEFQAWMTEIMEEAGVQGQFVSIGDGVNDIHTTQGVIVQRKGA